MLQTNPTCYVKYIFLLGALLCYSVFFQQYGSCISTGTLRSSQQTVAVLEARDPEAEKAKEETNEAKEEVVKAKQETKEATDLYLKARAEAEEAATEAVKAKEEAKRLRAQCQPFEDLTALKKNKPNVMDCEGFPDWPLSPADALFDDIVGAPKCNAFADNTDERYRWILHQTSAPRRRPSVSEVNETLSHLPVGTGYIWHSDDEICAFMRTQPLRFQALYNALERTPHRVDLWRYLLLHERGGVYLDDDAELLVQFNSSFVESVNSVYTTQNNNKKAMGTNEEERLFGYTIYNGLLITKPCNRVLLSVAESMVRIGQVSFKGLKTWETDVPQHQLLNWYNLKLLAIAIAERSPPDLPADVNCEAGPSNCTFFEKGTHHKVPFNNKRSVFVYRDDHDWPTAVFDTAQCKMVVQQVPGGKHDAVSVDPHPSPWFPNMTVSPTSDGRWGK